jgi:hypothetical protein
VHGDQLAEAVVGSASYLRWTVSCPDGTHQFTTASDFAHPPAVTMVSAGGLLIAQAARHGRQE